MRPFSAKVELPCRVFCGPNARLEFSGLVVNIDTGRLVLTLPERDGRGCLDLGEMVRLELLLPVSSHRAGAKCLNVRGRVAHMTEMPDGSWRLVLNFRRASFKDRPENLLRKMPKAATNGWMM